MSLYRLDELVCDRCGGPAEQEVVIERVRRQHATIGRFGTRREQFTRLICAGECKDLAAADPARFLIETRMAAEGRGVP